MRSGFERRVSSRNVASPATRWSDPESESENSVGPAYLGSGRRGRSTHRRAKKVLVQLRQGRAPIFGVLRNSHARRASPDWQWKLHHNAFTAAFTAAAAAVTLGVLHPLLARPCEMRSTCGTKGVGVGVGAGVRWACGGRGQGQGRGQRTRRAGLGSWPWLGLALLRGYDDDEDDDREAGGQ